MLKKVCVLILILTFCAQISFTQTNEKKDTAVLKYELPEFRDVSVWRGRLGLTRFSPDGKYLAVSGRSADVVIYDTATGELKTKIDGDGFLGFSFSPDGKTIVTQDKGDLEIKIYDLKSGKLLRSIRGLNGISYVEKTLGGGGLMNLFAQGVDATPFEMSEVPISPDWKNILVNKNDKEFALYNFDSGDLKYELNHQNFNSAWETTKVVLFGLGAIGGAPYGMLLLGSSSNSQFSPDGRHILIANGNKNPTLWNVNDGKLINKFAFKNRVLNVRFSPDGKLIAASDYGGIITISGAETGEIISSIGSKEDRRSLVAWSADGQKVFSVPLYPKKGDAKAHNAKTGEFLYAFDKSDTYIVLPDNKGDLLLTAPRKNKNIYFQIWDSTTGRLLTTVPRPNEKKRIVSIRWSPNDEMIAFSNGFKSGIELWSAKGELLQNLPNATFPTVFSPDGKLLLSGGRKTAGKDQKATGFLWNIYNY